MRFVKYTSVLSIVIVLYIWISISINKEQLKLTHSDISILKKELTKIEINSLTDFFNIQNQIIDKVQHRYIGVENSRIDSVFKYGYGECYDRSLILQKILLYNNYEIRPIYLFARKGGVKTFWFHLFSNQIHSHNIFEVKFYGEWYVIDTNKKQQKLIKIDEYIDSGEYFYKNCNFVRHLNNRNSKIIYPKYIIDIY